MLDFARHLLCLALHLAHLLLDGEADVCGGAPKLGQGLADRPAQLRQLAGPKNQQGQNRNDQHFGKADRTHNNLPLSRIIEEGLRSVKPPAVLQQEKPRAVSQHEKRWKPYAIL